MAVKEVPTGIDREGKDAVRLFDSDFLEFFTHISPIVVLVVWVPVVVYFLLRAVLITTGNWVYIPIWFLIGLFFWTLAEYVLHRFVFHFHPVDPSERVKRLFFMIHGVHHYQPRSKTRLVMPPLLSIPLAALFYGFFYWLVGVMFHRPFFVPPLFAGFIFGYICYDMLHYSMHHFSWKAKWFRKIRKHHMAHHFKTPDLLFGVSSGIWDQVFKTVGRENQE